MHTCHLPHPLSCLSIQMPITKSAQVFGHHQNCSIKQLHFYTFLSSHQQKKQGCNTPPPVVSNVRTQTENPLPHTTWLRPGRVRLVLIAAADSTEHERGGRWFSVFVYRRTFMCVPVSLLVRSSEEESTLISTQHYLRSHKHGRPGCNQ